MKFINAENVTMSGSDDKMTTIEEANTDRLTVSKGNLTVALDAK